MPSHLVPFSQTGLLRHFPFYSNWPWGQTQIPFWRIFPLEQVWMQVTPSHWVSSGHWQVKSNEFQTLVPVQVMQVFPFQLELVGQTIHWVPFQLPVLQTQSLSWKFQNLFPPEQVKHERPFQKVFSGHEHESVDGFHLCPVAHWIHENPFQFPLTQAQLLETAFHYLPPKHEIQTAPFQFWPAGQPHDLVAGFQFWPCGQVIQLIPFQFWELGQPQVIVAGNHTWLVGHLMQALPFQLPSEQTQVNLEVDQTWVSGQITQAAPFQLPAGQMHWPLTTSRILPPEHGSKHEYPFQMFPVGQVQVFNVELQVCPP